MSASHSVRNKVQDAVDTYHAGFRNPALTAPEVSELYSLDVLAESSVSYGKAWPDPWPNAGSPGVYLVLSKALEFLYIGKAALIGARLGAHFGYDENRNCKAKGKWAKPPRFLLTVSVSEWFEASSLEEYLIQSLKPLENKVWSDRSAKAP